MSPRLLLSTVAAALIASTSSARSDKSPSILFVDVTAQFGITARRPTYGASFGDFSGDGRPDLWVGNHGAQPTLYLNPGTGLMLDVAGVAVLSNPAGDAHGAAWADFDGDGDEDLLQLMGASKGLGSGPNQAYLQDRMLLTDQAVDLGLALSLGRGRTPLWLDWDGDGDLDVVTAHFARSDGLEPSGLHLQKGDRFGNGPARSTYRPAWPGVGFGLPGSHSFAQLSDLSGDGQVDLVFHGFPYPEAVFALNTDPPLDLLPTLGLPQTKDVQDAVLADLDGDLRQDLFLVTDDPESEAFLADPQTLEGCLLVSGNEEGLQVEVDGTVSMTLGPSWFLPVANIFIGAAGIQPGTRTFTLDPTNPTTHGLAPHQPGVDSGVYLGYDPVAQVWEVAHSWPAWNLVTLVLIAGQPIRSVTPVGFNPSRTPPSERLLLRRGRTYLDATVASGLGAGYAAQSVASGDFDNDGDLDLYLVRTGTVANRPNLLFENDGAGRFQVVPAAGGAAGSSEGRGDVAVTADVDGDGFLDLFLTNGRGAPAFSWDGPHQLFLNRGNRNHWLELDLVGSASNVHGIGARVTVTAGRLTQVREQGGGIHRHAQDHRRLHFGLGSRDKVDRLVITWPGGRVQILEDLDADQRLTVREPSGPPPRRAR